MKDRDSKLIFESYRASLVNEEFNADVVASKAATLDPEAGREFLHNLKAKDESRFMQVMNDILSGKTASDVVNKFKNEVWPKIKALVLGGKSEAEGHDVDEIDVAKSDLDNDGKLNDYEKARGAAIDKAQGGSGKMPEEK